MKRQALFHHLEAHGFYHLREGRCVALLACPPVLRARDDWAHAPSTGGQAASATRPILDLAGPTRLMVARKI